MVAKGLLWSFVAEIYCVLCYVFLGVVLRAKWCKGIQVIVVLLGWLRQCYAVARF